MGCICILSTVAGLAGLMLSGAWMSSNYRRTVQGCAPHLWKRPRSRRAMKRDTRTVLLGVATRAASNSRHFRVLLVACAAEVGWVSQASRLRALEAEGLLHPRADAVTAALFAHGGFFLAADKVQVKYEMLRAHLLDGVSVTAAAAGHGYSRAGFYLVAAAFEQAGMSGLLDEKRGRRGPVKLTAPIVEFLQSAPAARSGAELAAEVTDRFGVDLHRRTVERARRR
jgi:transposase